MIDNDDIELILDIALIADIVTVVERASEKAARKAKRSCWRRKWIARREVNSRGVLHLVHSELAVEDPLAFKNYLRVDEATFTKLLSMVEGKISKKDTNMRQCISACHKLTVTLRFLATGETYQSLELSTRIPACTISLFVPIVCRAIYAALEGKYMQVPKTEAEWMKVSDDFQRLWNYPNCIGAMDGKHIAFRPPRSAGSKFYNYKCFHSIVLLALVDAKYRFLYVDVGTNGRVSDGGTFRESELSRALQNNTLNVPKAKPLPNREIPTPFVIVADDAFSLAPNLMKPFPNRGLSIEERIHNYRLSRARRVSENVFGIFANRFRIFLGTINLSPEKVELITLTACALHNFLLSESNSVYMPTDFIDRDGTDTRIIPGTWREGGLQMTGIEKRLLGRASREPIAIRNEFKAYFNGEGAVSWQNDHIYNT